MEQEVTLNIDYDMHLDDWTDLFEVYKSMKGWVGFSEDGSGNWFGKEEDDEYIIATASATGLMLEAEIDYKIWQPWVIEFIAKASEALGYEVKITHIITSK